MLEEYTVNLGEHLGQVFDKVFGFLPNLILALITLALGWVFGIILGRTVTHIFETLKIDKLFDRLGLMTLSKKIGYEMTIGKAFGGLVKWSVIVSFLMAGVNILGLNYVSTFLLQIVSYLPNVFVAGFILIIASVLANFTEKVIDGSVRSVGMKAGYAGSIAKYAIIFTGVLAALSQLNIIEIFANALFIGIVSALSLAFGLAFGLGGKDAAARAIEKIGNDCSKE